MNIIIFGPQGSGKGTQAEYIARRHHVPYVSPGDIFRYHLKNQTALGAQVAAYLSAGQLVPDELTNQVIKDRISRPDCAEGFVLDGYPRNKVQQDFLNRLTNIDFVIVINLPDEVAIARLGGRPAQATGDLRFVRRHALSARRRPAGRDCPAAGDISSANRAVIRGLPRPRGFVRR